MSVSIESMKNGRTRRAQLVVSLLLALCYSSGAVDGSAWQTSGANYENLEALIDTSRGEIVIEFFPADAPKHVEYFVEQARQGAYDGTTFHRVIKYALIQGGDPLTKNASARARPQYGTGGLNASIPDEVNKNKHIAGAVSAVLAVDRANPNEVKPGSSGSQFFIVLNVGSAKAQLDSKFTVFAKVVTGMDVATEISATPAGQYDMATERVEIRKVTVREKTPTIEQMKAMTATIDTSMGAVKLQLLPESAPNTVRTFVRLAKAGFYDSTSIFRVSHKYYLEFGNTSDWPPDSANRKRFFSLWPISVEKSGLKHTRGTVSMRQIEEGFTKWYFFIISQDNAALDGKHVPFAKVAEGLDVIEKIAAVEVDGDKPKQRIDVKKITIQ